MRPRSPGDLNPMKSLAIIILAYTPIMLLIHVSTGKILKAWNGPDGSWISRRFPPQRALRVEALYWLLVLAGWSIWPSSIWKALVAVFAAIHLSFWLTGELRAIRLNGEGDSPSAGARVHRVIITFDLVEAVMLVIVALLAVLYLANVR